MIKQPYVSTDLLKHFQSIFPNTLPRRRDLTTEELAYLQGQQSVIERLAFYNEPEEELQDN